MDTTQSLRDTENSLRDFIGHILRRKFGEAWVDKCGVTNDRIEVWRQRKIVEEQRQESGVVEERLLYYADFYDLRTILEKHWSEFADALGDWKTMRVLLSELEKLRDPDAHRRELLPHQKYLAMGIAGEIRTRLIRYRSKQETSEDYFPRIESVRDSLGNIWTPDHPTPFALITRMTLRVGDVLDFVVTASDPLGAELEYNVNINRGDLGPWQKSNTFLLTLSDSHIGKDVLITFFIRSSRDFHANNLGYDHAIMFIYDILPRKM